MALFRRFVLPGLCGLLAAAAIAVPDPTRSPFGSSGASREAPKSVLILDVEQPHLPWVAGVNAGIYEVFEAAPPSRRPSVATEFLDVGTGRSPDVAVAQAAWFRQRYHGRHFDLIIAVTSWALDFVRPLREELWPDAAVILLTPRQSMEGFTPPPGVTVIQARFEDGKTLDLARDLFPGTHQVAYVVEDSFGADGFRSEVAKRGLGLIDLGGLTLEELEKRVRELPKDSIVYFFSFHTDPTGRRFIPREVAKRIAPGSNRPIFGVSATGIGYGMLGGWALDYKELGAETARVALRLLGGEAVGPLPAPSTYSRLVFDDRELRRWHVSRSRLPEGAEIFFRDLRFWERYPRMTASVAVLLLTQAVLIGLLLVERRRLRAADAERYLQRDEIAHLNRVGAMGELASSLAHELNQPLTAIVANAQAARRLLGQGPEASAELPEILNDIIEDDQRAGEIIRRMRSFVRKEDLLRTPVLLNEIVRSVIRLVTTDASLRGISLDVDLAARMPVISGDRIQLQQVVLNLVLNGLDAVAERPVGERRVQIRTFVVDGNVRLAVTDSGRGIHDGDLSRIFEPFYTTKTNGLGMGLSICRTIVEAHDGEIQAANGHGGGAVFSCVFPPGEGAPA